MDLFKRLKEIQNHLDTISDDEFEQNLKKAGYGFIEHSNDSLMKLKKPENTIYSFEKDSYQFEKLPDTTNIILVVA